MGVEHLKRPVSTPAAILTRDVEVFSGTGMPASGTSGDGATVAGPGSIYTDRTRGTLWVNRGTKASPYWEPVGYDQAGLWGVHTDFRDGVGSPLADGNASVLIASSGLRVYGNGIADGDSGAVANTAGEGGTTMRFTTANGATGDTIVLGTPAGVWQADQHGMAYVEIDVSQIALTTRAFGLGFLGEAADALKPPVKGATLTTTFEATGNEGNDLAGMFFDVGFTDPDAVYAFHNKNDFAADQDATTGGRDTSTNVAAGGTFQLWRVEMDPVSATVVQMRCFLDKVLVATITDALDEDEEHSPVAWLETTNTGAVRTMDVRRFSFVSGR